MDDQRRARYLRALDIGVWKRAGESAEIVESAPVAVADVPIESNPKAPMAPPKGSTTARSTPLPPTAAVVAAAPPREIPADWIGLQSMVAGCTACKLCRTRTQTVFGAGAETASLMVIGEGPGADEDAQGFPFVGRAGKLLDEMLKAIGRSRAETVADKGVYIANVVKCRPPANRDPESEEVAACRPYLDAQIEHVKPKLIVALGRIAAQRLLSSDEPLSKMRGPLHEYGERRTPVLITYHPAYLMRSPGEKAKSWADLKRVSRFLAEADGKP